VRRNLVVIVVLMSLVVAGGCSFGGNKSRLSGGAVLTGRVVMPAPATVKSINATGMLDGQVPVKGATVRVEGGTIAVTDSQGYFSISGLSPFRRYLSNAALPSSYSVQELQSFASPGTREPVEVSIATTAAVKSMHALPFRSTEAHAEFDVLLAAARNSRGVRDLIDCIRQGDVADIGETAVTNEIIDRFLTYYYPVDIQHTYVYEVTHYIDDWEPGSRDEMLWTGTGEEELI